MDGIKEFTIRLLRISKELKETEGYFSIGLNKLTDERLSNDLLMKVIIKHLKWILTILF